MDDFGKHMTPPTMRYAKIKAIDIENGHGVGMSLFVQGCRRHCVGCFNRETWDFDGGKEWTSDVEEEFMKLVSRPHISRVSILGGEPLEPENIEMVRHILHRIKDEHPEKIIYLYTGFQYSEVPGDIKIMCNYVIDGPYVESERDISLVFRGSRNQKIIKVEEKKC